MKYTSIIPEYLLSYSLRRLLTRGGDQHSEVTEEVVLDQEDIGMGRRKNAGVRDFFQGGGTGGSYIWVGYMGDDPHIIRVQGGGTE